MNRECFIKKGEYLSLSVPGLAENRPSIMIGDTVLASPPHHQFQHTSYFHSKNTDDNTVQYEGFVHEVRNSEVHFTVIYLYNIYSIKIIV